MSKNIINVDCGKNHYRIVPVEGSDKWFVVVKNGKHTKRISRDELFIDGDMIDIDNWFNIV